MIYILETKLSEQDSVYYALKNVYGINRFQASVFCKKLGFTLILKIKDLSEDQIIKLLKLIEFSDLKITSDLKKFKIFITKRFCNSNTFL